MRLGPVRSAAREVLLIVLGILIAFGLDAWWENRSRRAVELNLLRQLRTDLVSNLAELDRADSLREVSFDAARTLFALTGPSATPPPYAEVEALILRVAEGANTYEPRTGTVNSIIQAGRLELIEGDSLRLALAAWEEQLRDVREEEDRCIANLLEHFWPFLEGQVVFPSEGSAWENTFGPEVVASLLRDPGFATHVAQQMHRYRMALEDAADLRTLMLDMLRFVDTEVDGSRPSAEGALN